jgi:hypothetical protein
MNLNWDNAKLECESLGGRLVSARDQFNFDIIADISRSQRDNFWIGARTLNLDDNWTWLTGDFIKLTSNW